MTLPGRIIPIEMSFDANALKAGNAEWVFDDEVYVHKHMLLIKKHPPLIGVPTTFSLVGQSAELLGHTTEQIRLSLMLGEPVFFARHEADPYWALSAYQWIIAGLDPKAPADEFPCENDPIERPKYNWPENWTYGTVSLSVSNVFGATLYFKRLYFRIREKRKDVPGCKP